MLLSETGAANVTVTLEVSPVEANYPLSGHVTLSGRVTCSGLCSQALTGVHLAASWGWAGNVDTDESGFYSETDVILPFQDGTYDITASVPNTNAVATVSVHVGYDNVIPEVPFFMVPLTLFAALAASVWLLRKRTLDMPVIMK